MRSVAPEVILMGPFEIIPVDPGGCLVTSTFATRFRVVPSVDLPVDRIRYVPFDREVTLVMKLPCKVPLADVTVVSSPV